MYAHIMYISRYMDIKPVKGGYQVDSSQTLLGKSRLEGLPRGLLGNTALRQAALNAKGDIGREGGAELLKVGPFDCLQAQVGLEQLWVDGEQRLGGLLDARVLAGEAGDEYGIVAFVVGLEMQGSFGEDGHLVLLKQIADGLGAVLGHELRLKLALDDDVDL